MNEEKLIKAQQERRKDFTELVLKRAKEKNWNNEKRCQVLKLYSALCDLGKFLIITRDLFDDDMLEFLNFWLQDCSLIALYEDLEEVEYDKKFPFGLNNPKQDDESLEEYNQRLREMVSLDYAFLTSNDPMEVDTRSFEETYTVAEDLVQTIEEIEADGLSKED